MEDPSPPYQKIRDRATQLYHLESTKGLLRWDQEVMMPSGGTPSRSKQLSTVSALAHEQLTDDALGRWLSDLSRSSLSAEQRAVIREVERERERAVQVPQSLIEELSETASAAFEAWHEAKDRDDFDHFAPSLSKLVELRREYANHIDPDDDPYAVLFEEYEPYLPLHTVEDIFDTLRPALVELIDDIAGRPDPDPTSLRDGTYPPERQERFVRRLLDALGFDWDRGRLDTSPHPFSTGTPYDARITTRFSETDLLDGSMSTIHEFGHALYTLGLPTEHFGTPLARPRDLTVHESQSRLWENHIGRSRGFWDQALPIAADEFPRLEGVTPAAAYRAVNRVHDDNPIRVEADELTYHLHIILRFEIERALIAGDLSVESIPAVWNEKMEEYLGIRPDTDARGCLQDVHWSHGNFGYFPTYTLGSVLAAQLFDTLEDAVGPTNEAIRSGNFDPIHSWLGEHVHRHGSLYTTPELIETATGRSLEATPFLTHVTEKYRSLYAV